MKKIKNHKNKNQKKSIIQKIAIESSINHTNLKIHI